MGKTVRINTGEPSFRDFELALAKEPAERTAAESALVAKWEPALMEITDRFQSGFSKVPALTQLLEQFQAGFQTLPQLGMNAQPLNESVMLMRGPLHGSREDAKLEVLRRIHAELQSVTSRVSQHDEKLRAHEEELVRLRSGAPGRPSAMHLVLAEFEHRVALNQMEDSVTTQSEVLAAWLRNSHPDAASLKARTIRNNLATSFREAKARLGAAPAVRGRRGHS